MEWRLGTLKISLSATQHGVSPALFQSRGLKQRDCINPPGGGGGECPKRVPENRGPKFNQATQWQPAQSMVKEGGFLCYQGSPSPLRHLHKWSQLEVCW